MNYPKLRDVLAIVNGSTVVSVVVVTLDDEGGENHTRIWRGFPEYVSVSNLEKMGAHVVTHIFTACGELVLQCK